MLTKEVRGTPTSANPRRWHAPLRIVWRLDIYHSSLLHPPFSLGPFSPHFPLTASASRTTLSDRQSRSQVADTATATPHFDPGSGSGAERLCSAVTLLSSTKLRRCSTLLHVVAYFTALSTRDHYLVYAYLKIYLVLLYLSCLLSRLSSV